MNKTELVEKVAVSANLSKAAAKKALEATLASVKEALVAGERVQLIGFGTFSVNERPARDARNPRDGKTIHVPAKKVVKFKAGAEVAEAVQ